MHERCAVCRSLPALAVVLAMAAASPGADAEVRLDAAAIGLLSPGFPARHPFADPSGRLPLVVELPVGTDARAMGWQPLGAGLATVRLWPGDLARFEASHPGLPFSLWPPLRPVLDQSARLNGTLAYRAALQALNSPLAGTGKGVIVGIVDDAIDVTHADFRDALSQTRIAWMLDLGHPSLGKHPELEAAFGCIDPMQTPCAVLDKTDIDLALGDVTAYAPRDGLGHGTHVASIAAGNGGAEARYVGGAPEATIVFAAVGHGTLGEANDVDVVNGARFIFDRADAMGLPAVINISVGSDFGPHDGTSPVEKALAALVGADHPGRAIVVAAGNSAGLYVGDRPEQTLGVHTEVRVDRSIPARVPLLAPGRVGDPDVSGTVFVWATFRPTDDVAIGLEGPRGLTMSPVGVHQAERAASPDGSLVATVFNDVTDGRVPLTTDTHGAIIAWQGKWPATSEMILHFEGNGFVDLWEESLLDGGAALGDQFFEVATRAGTIGVPASHPDLISVGCTVNRTLWTDRDLLDHDSAALHGSTRLLAPSDSTCYFSSAGPSASGVMKPEVSAPGAMVVGAMSKDAVPGSGHPSIFSAPSGLCPAENECLVIDATHALLSGSSMSSPQVAGAVALLFERDATLTQPDIAHLLEQGARRPEGNVALDYQLGAGALDVEGAVDAHVARSSPVVREPDASRSWMSLSGGYLHPDARATVTGTVEMRASDGSLADGFDVARLSLEVSGGATIMRPLAREGTGLWRFQIAGLPDWGSGMAQIDVRLDGVPLGIDDTRLSGRRSLPVGADRWIAFGSARAYGGCSVAHRSPSSDAALWIAGLAILFGARRFNAVLRR
ncbi:MAG TPA: S8 family serine peptidase [Polyangiaceae bacterium]